MSELCSRESRGMAGSSRVYPSNKSDFLLGYTGG